ncbi:MAG: M81 family metallopeptidase [Chloroflexota bacterium]
MRIFIACLGTETNTYSPMPTGMATFADTMLHRGDATAHPASLYSGPLIVWRRLAEARGDTVIEGLAAFAEPAGRTTRAVHEALRDELLADLRDALPVDVVLLHQHGAMVAVGYDDCEGDLLERVRALVGPDVAVGSELDLHCHITPRMVDNATALVTYKEYPHVDTEERAAELFAICVGAAEGRVHPVMAAAPLHMVGIFETTRDPLRAFVARVQALEGRDGVLSVSFGHGFPYGDVADVGATLLVIADGDLATARDTAELLGREVWAMRAAIAQARVPLDVALDAALAGTARPVVIADVCDNAGGGAPSDATFVLRRILERGIGDVVSGLYWDPVAVRFCIEAGEGATFDLRVGGKCGPASGDPLDLRVTVRRILHGAQQTFGPSRNPVGDLAWVTTADDVDLVLNTTRTQVFHPDAFTQLGLDPTSRRIVVVKSMHHFHAGFAPIAARILHVAGPGALPSDYAAMPYTRRPAPFWPAVADPHGTSGPRATIVSAAASPGAGAWPGGTAAG